MRRRVLRISPNCGMSTTPPSLKDVVEASKRDDESILNVFLVGSRAWGTETATSDWDYFVVVKGEEDRGPLEMTDDGRINLTIFSEPTWRRWLVKEHNLQGIACLYLPSSNVLCNRHDWHQEFQLDKKRLRFSALRKASSSFNRARIYWLGMQDIFFPLPVPRITLTPEDTEAMKGLSKVEAEKKSKKMIAHGLRTVLFALQLFETSQLTDLKCVMPTWKELMDEGDEEWSYFVNKYESRWKALADQFPNDCEGLPDPDTASMPPILHRLHYLVNLPPFQSTYKLGITRELFNLIRLEHLANSIISKRNPDQDFPEDESLPSKPIIELIHEHFDSFEILPAMLDVAHIQFNRMVSFLQNDFNTLLKAVNKIVKEKGIKFGQAFATLSKPHPHYINLYWLSRTPSHQAEEYLTTCPWTHFDILEEYLRNNPAPTAFEPVS